MSTNYFKLLNLPVKLKLDHNKLKKNYFNLIRHRSKDPVINASNSKKPDKKEKELIKKAYDTLKGRISRIEHLLEIKGYKVANDNRTPVVFGPMVQQIQDLLNKPKKNQKCINELKKLHQEVITEFSTISLDLARLEIEWDNNYPQTNNDILKKLRRKTSAFSFIKDIEQDIRVAIN